MKDMTFDVTSFSNRRLHRINRLCVGDITERVLWSFPDKVALVGVGGDICSTEKNRKLTYRQITEKANQFANALLATGLRKEDRVLFFCANSTEFVVMQQGLAKSGLISVPVNVLVQPDVVDQIIREVEPKFLIVDAQLYPLAAQVFEKNNLRPDITVTIGGDPVGDSQDFEDFISGQPTTEPEVDIQPTDIFQIMYTSGTETRPKGVMHNHIYLYATGLPGAISFVKGVRTEIDIIAGIFFPIFHIACQTLTAVCFLCGGTAVIGRIPDLNLMLESITKEKIVFIFGGPPHIYELADLIEKNPDKYDVSSLKTIGIGWGSFRPDYDEKLRRLIGEDLLIIGLNGQTECVADTRYWHHMWYDTYKKTEPMTNHWGVPAPMFATSVMDEKGNLLPQGQTGEKVMRAPCMMDGYYKNEEMTYQAFKDGWFRSGDACYTDEEGVLVFTDRIKDVIKSGGENVVSGKVEGFLNMHPKIEQVAVVGLPHERWQEAVTAFVKVIKGETLTEEEIIDYCKKKGKLAGYETPKRVMFIDEIPMTVGSKMKKYVLRQEYAGLYKGERYT